MKTRSIDSTRNNSGKEYHKEDWSQRQWITALIKRQRLLRHPANDTTVARFVHSLRSGTVRAPKVLEAMLVIASSCALTYQSHAAAAQDLKSFNASESYLADGQSITLSHKLGQAVIQFDPAVTQ